MAKFHHTLVCELGGRLISNLPEILVNKMHQTVYLIYDRYYAHIFTLKSDVDISRPTLFSNEKYQFRLIHHMQSVTHLTLACLIRTNFLYEQATL
jgi:hypothetical protein